MKHIKGIIIFLSGAAIGSAITYKVVKDKIEKRTQEEINDYKEHVKNNQSEKQAPQDLANVAKNKEAVENYIDAYKTKSVDDYVDYTQMYKDDEDHKTLDEKIADILESDEQFVEVNKQMFTDIPNDPKIYRIEPNEFDMNEDYEKLTLNVYLDGAVTDELDEPLTVDEVDQKVGFPSITAFLDEEFVELYYRNEFEQTDYELLLVEENYHDKGDFLISR